ncbi:MAG: inositol monophosphatase family protein, partial [Acidimicrobiia bacterium]
FASWSGWADVNLEQQWTSILRRAKRSRGFGDFWGHMLVARGVAEVMAEPYLAIWDVAPLEVIVEEAGGKLTDFEGTPFKHPGSALSTNGIIHDEVVGILSG